MATLTGSYKPNIIQNAMNPTMSIQAHFGMFTSHLQIVLFIFATTSSSHNKKTVKLIALFLFRVRLGELRLFPLVPQAAQTGSRILCGIDAVAGEQCFLS